MRLIDSCVTQLKVKLKDPLRPVTRIKKKKKKKKEKNMAHMRQPRPFYGLGFQVQLLKTF